MALQDIDSYDDDYVILSHVDAETGGSATNPQTTTPPRNSSLPQQKQPQDSRRFSNSNNGTGSGSGSSGSDSNRTTPATQDEDTQDSDFDDIVEIEYGYDNDTLLIMPAMLRDYSHHATNYHPELWRSPLPGQYSPQPSPARCRQEDRMLDRQELLKNSIAPTTCGICFESFTTFDLDPLQHQEIKSADISTRTRFALAITSRFARSFAPNQSANNNNNIPDTPSSSSSAPLSTTSSHPSTSTSHDRPRSLAAPTITPSISSKDIGIVMPCDHGLCLTCLQSFLTNATQNPQARFPTLCPQPGCRTPIPTESAELVLDSETLEVWYRKLAEIHVANKVFCPRPECRSIIDLDDRDGMTCEQYQSQGGDSEEDRAMLRLVRDRHWRHCPSCRFVIEKQQGCNHMICHCGQSFCYACGDPWNELDARCSQDCENYGAHDDMGVDCSIM
ncbi:hypothetical protein BGZ99_001399 [Dissophora globulifera]|uniref:RING-type domain-containing protein n=1 Tax=Dissophora globulifera TaxID=979702 RepID=A0A9P6RRJ6_9FUNG|nr:hypothetical protein BGZ99_001399 [Dissophora globulifera]